MKKILLAMLFSGLSMLTVSAQHTYISTSGTMVLKAGSTTRYLNPDIYVNACYDNYRAIWIATLQLGPAGATTDFEVAAEVEFTNATIDALTASGATNTEKQKNLMLQAVRDYLVALNGSLYTLN